MMSRHGVYLVVSLLLALAPCRLLAAPVVSVEVGADARWFDWREFNEGKQLLSEVGPQVLGAAQLAVTSGAWRASVESHWGGGFAHYDGQLQSGEEYESDAVESVLDTDWRIAWHHDQGEVSVGMLQRDWRRFIEGSTTVSSAEERYRWRLLVWGLAASVVSTDAWDWRFAVRAGMPFERKEKVYLSGGYDDATLEPGNGLYWRLALPVQSRSESRLVLEPYYQEQRLRRSEMVPLTQNGMPSGLALFQPASVRRELGIAMRWQLRP